jgi:hypothetical protein
MIFLLAQAAIVPPMKPLNKHALPQIVLLRLRDQNLRLLRQARQVREARRTAARAHAHETFLRFPVEGLRADVARLPLRIVGARLDRDRDGLLVFFVGVVLFCVAAAVYFLAHLLVAAAPVVMLASGVAVAQFTSNTSRRVVGQWGGAGGAVCEDHFALVWRL